MYKQKRQAVYVTEPYMSALGQFIMTSATAAIVNPSTDEYIGQVNYDFIPRALETLFDTLDDDSIAFVTGAHGEVFVANKQDFGEWNTTKVDDLLFPYDDETAPFRQEFERSIFPSMMIENNFTAKFSRTSAEGSPEMISIASHAVKARSLVPIDPSDFSRGCTMNSGQVVYIVGIVYQESQRNKPWELKVDAVEADLRPIQIAYLSIIVTSMILFVAVSFKVRKAGWVIAFQVDFLNFSIFLSFPR